MRLYEITPGTQLRPYVKCYFVFESETEVELQDMVFPNGFMEIMFNLGSGQWRTTFDTDFKVTPPVELWGQVTQPMTIQCIGKNTMLGIRFYPHSAAYFLKEDAWEFNNQISDLRDVLGSSVKMLHAHLVEVTDLKKRIELLELFLLDRLKATQRKQDKLAVIGRISQELEQKYNGTSGDKVKVIASRYKMTPRYLQKLFLQHIGVTPKLYSKINRFQLSLRQMNSKEESSLTSIAYDCGYFDQSHFIREFKSFTGFTPSAYLPELFPVTQVFTGN